MRQWLFSLFNKLKKPSPGRSPAPTRRQARLGVEALEARQVMTAALGGALHQVVPLPSSPVQTVQASPATNTPLQFNTSSAQTIAQTPAASAQNAVQALMLHSLHFSPSVGALGNTSNAAEVGAHAAIQAFLRSHFTGHSGGLGGTIHTQGQLGTLAAPAAPLATVPQGPTKITAVEVSQDGGSPFAGENVPLPALQQIRDKIAADHDAITQRAMTQLAAGINKKLPDGGTGDWSVHDLNLNIPRTLDDSNSELDATVNPDGSVRLDLVLRNVSGSFSVAVPQGLKDGIGAASGAAAGSAFGPLGGLIGAGIGALGGSQLSDPSFSFTTDMHITINVPDPIELVGAADGINGFFSNSNSIADNFKLPPGAIQEQATNIQVSGNNLAGDAAILADKVAGFIPDSVVMQSVDSTLANSVNKSVGQLAGILQNAQRSGALPVGVSIDGSGNLVYTMPGLLSLAGLNNPPSIAPPSNAPPVFLH